MDLVRYREGRTVLVVPRASVTEVPPPTAPVFFNPAASLNRDVTVAVAAAAGCETFCDSMAGVGARGVRVAREVRGMREVVLVDHNQDALKLARRSASLNGVSGKCAFARSETSSYLYSRFGKDQRFDSVDLDPFGTPIRQVHAAINATMEGGILSVTATDTAVLCGVHQSTCARRYGSTPVNNHFHHETGLRILLASLARNAASLDIGVEPVLVHSTRHYLRAFVRVNPGAANADSSLRELGFVAWCPACGEVHGSKGAPGMCPVCSKKLRLAGPLWVGNVVQEPLVRAARKEALDMKLLGAAEVLESLIGVNEFPPWSHDIDLICSELKVPTTSELSVYRRLIRGGRRVMRTPFEKTGLKTDAGYHEVADAVREASVEARQGARASSPRSSNRARS